MPYIPGETLSEQLTYVKNATDDIQDLVNEMQEIINRFTEPLSEIQDAIHTLENID